MEKVTEKNNASCKLAVSMVRDIDRKMVGKDGKPLRPAIRIPTASNPKFGTPLDTNTKPNGVKTHEENPNVGKTQEENPKSMTLFNEDKVEHSDFVLPIENVLAAQNKFANSLVGFFVGKIVAFPLVLNYVTNTLSKFGFQKVIKDDDDVFYFKFSSTTGLEQGRMGYARALIEISTESELKKEVKMVVPIVEGEGHTIEQMRVEYEWRPPRCPECLIFGLDHESCPKRVVDPKVNLTAGQEDGFTMVQNRKKEGKKGDQMQRNNGEGVKLKSSQPKFVWSIKKQNHANGGINTVKLKNHFDAHQTQEDVTVRVKLRKFMLNRDLLKRGQALPPAMVSIFSVASWNIRGLNHAPKQSEVRQVVYENNLSVCAILESHVDVSSLYNVCSKVFRSWEWTSNANLCSKGCRIIIGWNKDVVDAMIMSQSSQAVDAKLTNKADQKSLFCTFVYVGNDPKERRHLWADLGLHKMVDCVKHIEVLDINSSGLQYTWNQKPRGKGGTLKKLDRVMGNMEFIDIFSGAHAIFQQYRISDHSPAVLKIPTLDTPKPKPFMFYNFLTHKAKFLETVMDIWKQQVNGYNMFQVVQKMKLLKKPLGKLLHDQGNLHDRVNRLRVELDEVQAAIDKDPFNVVLRDEEAAYIQAFNEAKVDEERFLKQKAKIEWLEVGDSDSAYFHKSVKSQNQHSRIEVIRNGDNVEITGPSVPDVFVEHYEAFLGTHMSCDHLDDSGQFQKKVSNTSSGNMIRPVTNVEIKKAMFDIGDDKAPGPDGYTSAFFKKVRSLLIALSMALKRLLVRISRLLFLVNIFRTTFTQEIMHNYHRDRGPPRCAFKVDIQKAYDTVDWRFLEHTLKCFGFPHLMITWIMACVTSASFSISINENIHGLFNGKRGLRQGDPLSPYLFTLVMEVLTLILQRRVRLSNAFHYHKHCEELRIINVCFADDLFLFARGELDSAKLIMDALDEFKMVSGLIPSIPKTTAFFCNVPNHVKLSILNIMPFLEEELPVKYLGVPLISSRLLNKDYKILVEKVQNRVGDWKNKSLSFADYKWGKAKVAWADVCLPKKEGGLGLRSLEVFNLALMTTHLWNIASNKESLWCSLSPLIRFLSPRDITREGFSTQSRVADLIVNDAWNWPQRCVHGRFYVLAAWRFRGITLFGSRIAFRAFHLWLVMKRCLKTQDKLRPWDVEPNNYVRGLAEMDVVSPSLHDIAAYIQPIAKSRTVKNIIGKLLVAASLYFLWIERNNRLFKKGKRSPEEICDVIMVTVRLKLMTLRFKKSTNVSRILERWKMPTTFRLYGS
ncbi:hypothetical protein Tco_0418407 [Tanacetum coccineum]